MIGGYKFLLFFFSFQLSFTLVVFESYQVLWKMTKLTLLVETEKAVHKHV